MKHDESGKLLGKVTSLVRKHIQGKDLLSLKRYTSGYDLDVTPYDEKNKKTGYLYFFSINEKGKWEPSNRVSHVDKDFINQYGENVYLYLNERNIRVMVDADGSKDVAESNYSLDPVNSKWILAAHSLPEGETEIAHSKHLMEYINDMLYDRCPGDDFLPWLKDNESYDIHTKDSPPTHIGDIKPGFITCYVETDDNKWEVNHRIIHMDENILRNYSSTIALFVSVDKVDASVTYKDNRSPLTLSFIRDPSLGWQGKASPIAGSEILGGHIESRNTTTVSYTGVDVTIKELTEILDAITRMRNSEITSDEMEKILTEGTSNIYLEVIQMMTLGLTEMASLILRNMLINLEKINR